MKKVAQIISLFSGVGGLDLGFEQEFMYPILAFDKDEASVETYNLNNKNKIAIQADIQKTSVANILKLVKSKISTKHPLGIIGGPPCQGFSQGNANSITDDPRNKLPFRYIKILDAINHKYCIDFFVFENVPGLKSSKHYRRYKKIINSFIRIGFNVFEKELNAINYGVPQRRKRMFIVGLNKKKYKGVKFTFPNGNDKISSIDRAIRNLPEPGYCKRGSQEKIPFHPNHWTMIPRSPKFKNDRFNLGRSFRKLEWGSPSSTVAYGNREIHVHPEGKRRLSVLEAMLLQGFPRRFKITGNFSEQINQISNAVPPPLAKAIASNLSETIKKRRVKND